MSTTHLSHHGPRPGATMPSLARRRPVANLLRQGAVAIERGDPSGLARTVEQRVEQIERRYRQAATASALSDTLAPLPFISDPARADAASSWPSRRPIAARTSPGPAASGAPPRGSANRPTVPGVASPESVPVGVDANWRRRRAGPGSAAARG